MKKWNGGLSPDRNERELAGWFLCKNSFDESNSISRKLYTKFTKVLPRMHE